MGNLAAKRILQGVTDGSVAISGQVGESIFQAINTEIQTSTADTPVSTVETLAVPKGAFKICYSVFARVIAGASFGGRADGQIILLDSTNTVVKQRSAFMPAIFTGSVQIAEQIYGEAYVDLAVATNYKLQVVSAAANDATHYSFYILQDNTNWSGSNIKIYSKMWAERIR